MNSHTDTDVQGKLKLASLFSTEEKRTNFFIRPIPHLRFHLVDPGTPCAYIRRGSGHLLLGLLVFLPLLLLLLLSLSSVPFSFDLIAKVLKENAGFGIDI